MLLGVLLLVCGRNNPSIAQQNDRQLASTSKQELLKAENALSQAVIKKDAYPYEQVMDPDFHVLERGGKATLREAFLSQLKDQNMVYKIYAKRNITIKFYLDNGRLATYGDTALIKYQLSARGLSQGKWFGKRVCVSHPWRKKGNRWILLSEWQIGKRCWP